MAKTSAKVKDRWNKKAYDSILIRVKKGSKKIIEENAKLKNESVNYFITDAIESKIEKFKEEKGELKMKKIINKNGKELDFEASVNYMDDEIREKIHSEFAPCTEQEFFSAYEKAHKEKYGAEWELSKSNPVW